MSLCGFLWYFLRSGFPVEGTHSPAPSCSDSWLLRHAVSPFVSRLLRLPPLVWSATHRYGSSVRAVASPSYKPFCNFPSVVCVGAPPPPLFFLTTILSRPGFPPPAKSMSSQVLRPFRCQNDKKDRLPCSPPKTQFAHSSAKDPEANSKGRCLGIFPPSLVFYLSFSGSFLRSTILLVGMPLPPPLREVVT